MKKPEQIKQWMIQQEWYPKFVKNMEKQRILEPCEPILFGLQGKYTIGSAFAWDSTYEGFDFWDNVDRKFLEWFNKED